MKFFGSVVTLNKNLVWLCPSSVNEESIVFSGMEKGLPVVLEGGEDSLEFFTIRLRREIAKADFLSAIQVGSWFEAGFPVWVFI